MKPKRSSKNKRDLDEMLDDCIEETNESSSSTTTATQAHPLSNINTGDSSNVNPSNSTNSTIDLSTQTSSIKQDLVARPLTSKVWQYANKLDNGKQAACSLCDFVCSCNGHSTSTIRQHLISKHDKKDLILPLSNSSKTGLPEALKKELHQLCYYAIIKDSRPFNDFNKIGIKSLINKLCPGYSPPHRNQVSRHMEVLYNHHYQLLKEELRKVYRLSITFDFWCNRRGESFLCITGHWLTDDIDTVSKIIDFSVFNHHHTGIDIAHVVKEKLVALEIYEKIICITCDGAENMVLACYLLNDEIPRIWCCGHRLHLVVINGLGFWLTEDKIDDYSSDLSMATTATTTTTTTTANNGHGDASTDVNWDYELDEDSWVINKPSFNDESPVITDDNPTIDVDEDEVDDENMVEFIFDVWSISYDVEVNPAEQKLRIISLLKKCRAIASIIKRSSIISEYFRKERKSIKSDKTVRGDCKSRWNSTFTLIHSLIDLKNLIIKLFSDKRSLKLRRDQIIKLTTIELNSEDWELLNSLDEVLKPFFLGTELMSGARYPSIGICYYSIQKLKSFCTKDMDCDEQTKKMKKMLLDKLSKYFHDDYNQLQHLQRFAYFDPASHLCLNDKEKHQIELYIKQLINDDVYPINLPVATGGSATSSSTSTITLSSTLLVRANQAPAQARNSTSILQQKVSTFDDFISACGEDEPTLMDVSRQKSKRILINEEIKYFKLAAQEFHLSIKPSPSSSITFWKIYKDRLPLLTHLAKIHLSACGTSVPSEAAFSISAYTARKERARLSGENLAYSVFLKDKVLIDN